MLLQPKNTVRLAAFDMDGTLLSGRLVFALSEKLGNDGKVKAIRRNEVIVEEFYSDEYGARKKRDVGMKLMSE